MEFVVVIPARFASSRLPGKPLADICGKPMIQHVYEKAIQSSAKQVVIATDHQQVFDVAKSFGAEVVMTRTDHQSGTERLAEVVDIKGWSDNTLVVNVQGDEPLLPFQNIDQVAGLLADSDAPMATLSVEIEDHDELNNPNAVKVVSDNQRNALYFSRAQIPFQRDRQKTGDADSLDKALFQRHIGIYAYRAGFIQKYIDLSPSKIEVIEALEQLRVLYHGYKIKIEQAAVTPPTGVDTQQDLDKVIELVSTRN